MPLWFTRWRVFGQFGPREDRHSALLVDCQGVVQKLFVEVFGGIHDVGDGVAAANIEIAGDSAANQVHVDEAGLAQGRQGCGNIAGDGCRPASADGRDHVNDPRPLAHSVNLCDAFDGGRELLRAHGQRNKFLDAQVHCLHEQVGVNRLAHEEEVDGRELARERCDLLQGLGRVGVEVDDREHGTVGLAEELRERLDVRELRDWQGSESDQEACELFPVGIVRVNDDAIHLDIHSASSLL